MEGESFFFHEIYILIFIYLSADSMKKLWLVFPGYCIGLGGLVLITYRTMLAVLSQSKEITLQVNRYGEQYMDLFVLCFLWTVCAIGLWSLFRLMKDRENTTIQTDVLSTMHQQSDSFFFMNNGPTSPVIFLKSLPSPAQGYFFLDEGDLSTASVSMRVVQENLSVEL